MKKTIISVIFSLTATIVSAQIPAAPDTNNLLKNPEFRTDASGKLLNWKSYPSFQVKDGTLTLDVKNVQPWNKKYLWAGISQGVNLPVSGKFKLSFDLMAKNVEVLLIRILCMNRTTRKTEKCAEKTIAAKEYADALKKVEYIFNLPESSKSFLVYIDFIANNSAAGAQAQIKNVNLNIVK